MKFLRSTGDEFQLLAQLCRESTLAWENHSCKERGKKRMESEPICDQTRCEGIHHDESYRPQRHRSRREPSLL
jgi:hypothetical protein